MAGAVWVVLVQEGMEDSRATKIHFDAGGQIDVDDLCKEAKNEFTHRLAHVDASDLTVSVSREDDTKLEEDTGVPFQHEGVNHGALRQQPLYIHAPAQPPAEGGNVELVTLVQELRLDLEAERKDLKAERERAEKREKDLEAERERAEKREKDLEAERERAEKREKDLKRQYTLATATPTFIFDLVCQALREVVNETKRPPPSAPPTPSRFETDAPGRSPYSASTGTEASEVQFPNEHVEVSQLEFPVDGEVPPIVCQLLWSTQMFLTELSEAIPENASISETQKIQPVIRAFFEVLVEALDIRDSLKVLYPGDGVKTSVQFRTEQTVRGIPDFVVSSTAKAPNHHWGDLTEGDRKLCKALLLGEVKLHRDAVCEALEHQARWYLFGVSGFLGSGSHGKGSHFGGSRFAVATDGFSWGFLKSEGIPDGDSAKWSIERVEVSADTEQVACALFGMLTELRVNAPRAASGDSDDDFTRTSSDLFAAEPPGSVDNLSPGHRDAEHHDSLQPAANPFGEGVQGVQNKGFKRLSNVSCAMTVCKSSPIVRGDGIPRGMDVKAFAEMTSAERVEALFGGGHG